MGRRKQRNGAADAMPHVRVKLHIDGDAIGPGKIELLRRVDEQRTISAAARSMGITYRRAWHLIDTINAALGAPVVETEVGGARGGGAALTALGRELIARYEQLQASVAPAARPIEAWAARRRGG